MNKTENNILTKNKFFFESVNIIGTLTDCYEKYIKINDFYRAYISVDINSSEVYIYIEFINGDEVATYSTKINSKWNQSEENFYNELLDYSEDIINLYN